MPFKWYSNEGIICISHSYITCYFSWYVKVISEEVYVKVISEEVYVKVISEEVYVKVISEEVYVNTMSEIQLNLL